VKNFSTVFWEWYERTYTLNVTIAFILLFLQVIHLTWLGSEVVWAYIFGEPLFVLEGIWKTLIILVDYVEIPALVSVSLIYINELRQRFNATSMMYLVFLNMQWLHLFWISDEFVETAFNQPGTVLPLWLAWIAVGIDYLEVPVIFDTGKKLFKRIFT